MTNKEKAIQNAVFYAHGKPELLAALIAPLVRDEATTVSVGGPVSVDLDTENGSTVSYEAAIYSQFGDTVEGKVTYALKKAVTGISISGSDVTIAKTVANGTQYTVVATSGSLSAEVTTTVNVVS